MGSLAKSNVARRKAKKRGKLNDAKKRRFEFSKFVKLVKQTIRLL